MRFHGVLITGVVLNAWASAERARAGDCFAECFASCPPPSSVIEVCEAGCGANARTRFADVPPRRGSQVAGKTTGQRQAPEPAAGAAVQARQRPTQATLLSAEML